MAKDVIMPVLGMNQDSGVLLSWLKSEGDTVAEGEPLMEVETDKAVMEVEATASGTLVNVTAAEGDDVPTGTVIAQIAGEGEAVPERPAEGSDAASAEGVDAASDDESSATDASAAPSAAATPAPASTPATSADAESGSASSSEPARRDIGERVMASPKARRLAAERGVDLAALAGSGPGGAVIARDVPERADAPPDERADERAAPAPAPAVTTQLERTVDAGAVASLLERLGERRDVDPAPTLSALLVKFAAAGARRRAVFGDDGRPVDVAVRGSDARRSLAGASELGLSAIAARLTSDDDPDDLAPLHLSVTVLDGVRSDAVRDAPEGGLALGASSLEPRVIAVDGDAVVRPTVTLTLTADPQRVDAGRAAQLFDDLVGLFADPSELVVLF